MKHLVLALLLLSCSILNAQNFDWWVEQHNWDGYTHWHKYINISARTLGPNALPVPEIQNGAIDSTAFLDISAAHHRGYGDITSNLFTKIHLPLYNKKIAVQLWGVPLEHYQMEQETRFSRRIRTQDGRGFAGGDIYFGTLFQILTEENHPIDLLLSANVRTASGTKLRDARFSDTPGYYFDLSMGKTHFPNKERKLKQYRLYSMFGLYVYQTYLDNHRQNDAFLYGVGITLDYELISLQQQIGGYIGYLNNGDRPVVLRTALTTRFAKNVNYSIRFQQGFKDFKYSSLMVGCKFNFSKLLHI